MKPAEDIKNTKIISFSQRHLEACSQLYTGIFRDPPWNEAWTVDSSLALLKKIISRKHFIGFTAEYNDEAIGYLLGYPLGAIFPLNRIFYLNELFVDAGYQNMKIGKRLVEKLICSLSKRGMQRIVLLTKKDSNAEIFYKKMGFKRMIRGSINKRIIMLKKLRQSSVMNGGY